jgi:hypothetical protein
MQAVIEAGCSEESTTTSAPTTVEETTVVCEEEICDSVVDSVSITRRVIFIAF